MIDKAAIVLRDTLEKCARTSSGHWIDPSDRIVGLLMQRGLLEPVHDGTAAVTTPMGLQILSGLYQSSPRGRILRAAAR